MSLGLDSAYTACTEHSGSEIILVRTSSSIIPVGLLLFLKKKKKILLSLTYYIPGKKWPLQEDRPVHGRSDSASIWSSWWDRHPRLIRNGHLAGTWVKAGQPLFPELSLLFPVSTPTRH